uniref:Uncharacterized protein n=1 Tax=Anguilla anguilla TaxID=7936 RepID=A0A0E9PJ91_ANGAN
MCIALHPCREVLLVFCDFTL